MNKNRKILTIALIFIFSLLQYKLWFANGGIRNTFLFKKQIAIQKEKSKELMERNAKTADYVKSLKENNSSIESQARRDLGMIKRGELFYQTNAN